MQVITAYCISISISIYLSSDILEVAHAILSLIPSKTATNYHQSMGTLIYL